MRTLKVQFTASVDVYTVKVSLIRELVEHYGAEEAAAQFRRMADAAELLESKEDTLVRSDVMNAMSRAAELES